LVKVFVTGRFLPLVGTELEGEIFREKNIQNRKTRERKEKKGNKGEGIAQFQKKGKNPLLTYPKLQVVR